MTAISMLLVAGACAGGSEDGLGEPVPSPSSTSTTVAETTTTSAVSTTPTTLSPEAQAEAEIEQLIVDWWTAPYDSSLGEEGLRLEFLTGLFERRIREDGELMAAEGQIARSGDQERVQVLEVSVNLEQESGAVTFCWGSNAQVIDASTGEVLGADNPTFTTTSRALVEKTSEGWRISDYFPSRGENSDGPEPCTIEGVSS